VSSSQNIDAAAVQRRTMWVLVGMQVIGMIGVGAAPSVGILLANEVTENEAIAGLARSSTTLGAALFGLPLGNLAARSGRRTALTLGWFVAAFGAGLLVLAAQFSLVVPLFLGLFGIGAGTAAGLQSRFAATDLAPASAKARSLALVVWVGTLGSVLGPNLGVPGEWLGERLGLTVFAGAFLIAAVCLAVAAIVVWALLRPDPLRTLQAPAPVVGAGSQGSRLRLAMAEIRHNPQARYALVAILVAQSVMVAVMTMTPVHLTHLGDSVTIIGITISLHVAGMYVLAPVVGWCVGWFGHRATIGIGVLGLAASCLVGALRPGDTSWVVVSLVLLGVGWSFVNVAASALFSGVVADAHRAQAQGGVDALANLCAAVAAFASGPLMAVTSFSALALVALALLVPLAVLTMTARLTAR
jgi:MFS family permease